MKNTFFGFFSQRQKCQFHPITQNSLSSCSAHYLTPPWGQLLLFPPSSDYLMGKTFCWCKELRSDFLYLSTDFVLEDFNCDFPWCLQASRIYCSSFANHWQVICQYTCVTHLCTEASMQGLPHFTVTNNRARSAAQKLKLLRNLCLSTVVPFLEKNCSGKYWKRANMQICIDLAGVSKEHFSKPITTSKIGLVNQIWAKKVHGIFVVERKWRWPGSCCCVERAACLLHPFSEFRNVVQ